MESSLSENEYREQRIVNLRRLGELGYQPFGQAYQRSGRLSEIREGFEENKKVCIAGRLVTKRKMGKSLFAHVQDGSDRFQIYIKKNKIGDDAFAAFKVLDVGDHIGVEGELFTTKTGEPTLKVTEWVLLSKSLLPLPEKWHGLQDVETRYRQRYLDLIANPEVRDLFNKRIETIKKIRNFLVDRGFCEVETPMIQSLAGGAAAQPFKTHYEALNTDMYLRIAPELYLKKLLVGGFDKVFELNRNFRNEGLSRSHNPEFTMLEIYEAYGDRQSMMKLVQDLILDIAQSVFGTLKVGSEENPVDLSQPWREVPYKDLIKEVTGEDWYDLNMEAAQAKAKSLGIETDSAWNFVELTQEVFEKLIEKTLINPTFVTRLPVELVPLAKQCEDDSSLVDVFELIVGGREIAPAYTELNNPLEQRKRFEEQAAGNPSKIDEDFLMALEYGMPPAGGMGIGIDRLIMVLSGAEAIRDVILFPQLKPL